MTGQAPLAPGVVRVRLTGHQDDTAALAAVLNAIPAVEILTGPDGPYPNRRQPGHRLYLTLQLTKGLPAMSTEPTHDASNIHLAQGRTVATMHFPGAAATGPGAAEGIPPFECGPECPALDHHGPAAGTAGDTPEAIENGAEPDDALNPHAESEITEPPGWQDALDMAYGAAEARQALFAATRSEPEAGL